MKKISQNPPLAGISNIYMKRQELQKTINDSLGQFNKVLQDTQKQLTDQVTQQLNTLVDKLNADVEQKLNEIQRLIPQPTAQPTQPAAADDGINTKAYFQGGGGVNEPKKKKDKKKRYKGDTWEHPTARGDGEETPMYWKRNFDYGEGPYQNLEKMKGKKITDYEDTLIPDGRYKEPKKRRKK